MKYKLVWLFDIQFGLYRAMLKQRMVTAASRVRQKIQAKDWGK